MTKHLNINELISGCSQEVEAYKTSGQAGPHCLALFNKALIEGDETAFNAIYTQFKGLVKQWVYRHPSFYSTKESADTFVNNAFDKFWQFAPKAAQKNGFKSTNQYLAYLKRCVISVIYTHHRKRKQEAKKAKVENEDVTQALLNVAASDETRSTESQVFNNLASKTLWQRIKSELKNNKEVCVATESWSAGLKPQQIYTRHTNLFESVAEVSQVKRNIIKRLRRKLKSVNSEQ